MTRLLKVLWIFILQSAFTTNGYSQEQIPVSRINGEIKFDGIVDDECWKNVQPLSMVMHIPIFGNQPSEKSEVMICYDNTYLYIGARLYDSDASKMLISSKKRDESNNWCFSVCENRFQSSAWIKIHSELHQF